MHLLSRLFKDRPLHTHTHTHAYTQPELFIDWLRNLHPKQDGAAATVCRALKGWSSAPLPVPVFFFHPLVVDFFLGKIEAER